MPRVNYRLESVRVTPARAALASTIDVPARRRAVREPVEVKLDRPRAAASARWSGTTTRPSHPSSVDLPAGLASVEIDPRHRLVETALGSLPAVDDPRMDNRRPPRWRLLYEGAGALFNISQTSLNFAIGLLAKPQHDLRQQVEISAFHNETSQIGVGVSGRRGFGGQADRNRLASLVTAGLTGARLESIVRREPGRGAAERVARQRAARLRITTRATTSSIPGARRVVGHRRVHADRARTRAIGCRRCRRARRCCGCSSSRRVTCFAIAGESSATFGDVQLFAQLPSAGGPLALRGYGADELLARSRAIGRIELRDDYCHRPRLEPPPLHDRPRLRRHAVRGRGSDRHLRDVRLRARPRLLRRGLQLPRPARRVRPPPAAPVDRHRRAAQPPRSLRAVPRRAARRDQPTARSSVLVSFFPSF